MQRTQAVCQVGCEIPGLNLGTAFETGRLESCRGGRIPGVAVKCVEIWRNTGGEGGPLDKD